MAAAIKGLDHEILRSAAPYSHFSSPPSTNLNAQAGSFILAANIYTDTFLSLSLINSFRAIAWRT